MDLEEAKNTADTSLTLGEHVNDGTSSNGGNPSERTAGIYMSA